MSLYLGGNPTCNDAYSAVNEMKERDEDIVQEVLGKISRTSKVQVAEKSDDNEKQSCPPQKNC